MNLKINNVAGYSGTVSIKTDSNGVPLLKLWRNRLRDSKTDNCVEIIHKKVKVKEKVL